MFQGLIESRPRAAGKRSIRAGYLSVFAHAAVIAGAVGGPATVGRGNEVVVVTTPMVYLKEPRSEPKPPETPPKVGMLPEGFRNVVPPIELPVTIPSGNLMQQFNPADYPAIGVESSRAAGGDANGDPYVASLVEDKPALLAAPQPRYPELLLRAGIQGRVVVQAIIDTTGRAEPRSIRILQSPSVAFDKPSREWMERALFRPGRVYGRPVRVLVDAPINYEIVGR